MTDQHAAIAEVATPVQNIYYVVRVHNKLQDML